MRRGRRNGGCRTQAVRRDTAVELLPMNLEAILLRLPAMLVALTVHEYFHALTAYWRGDPTARDAGRLTLNPLPHIDPLGLMMILWGPFGWAKPVPVNAANLRNPKRDLVLVSAAGPAANLALALLSGALISVGVRMAPVLLNEPYILRFFRNLFLINAILPAFNLLPFPPLDGSKILAGLLPRSKIAAYYKFSRHASLVLVLMLVSDWVYSEFHLGLPLFSYTIWPILYPYLGLWRLLFGAQVI
jgi:Zn-dependent protease